MSEQKLRKFRLIDEDGFIKESIENRNLLSLMVDDCLIGYEDDNGFIVHTEDYDTVFICEGEFQFFEELPLEEEGDIQQEPPSNEVSVTFSDEVIHCIKGDCHAVNGSLCFYKEGVVFLWNEDEYFIESVDDYNKVINSIKVLNSFKK